MNENENAGKRLLVAIIYPPAVYSPTHDAGLVSVANSIDMRELMMDDVPRSGSGFRIDTKMYVCLRVEDRLIPEGYAAVVFVTPRQAP